MGDIMKEENGLIRQREIRPDSFLNESKCLNQGYSQTWEQLT